MGLIIVDTRIALYPEDSIRILAMVDTQNGTVSMSNILPYMPPKDPFKDKTPEQVEKVKQLLKNTIVVVDVPEAFGEWDKHFRERDHLDDAVRAYFSLKAQGALVLKDVILQRYAPDGVVQISKTDTRGNQYEFDSSTITNGHVAVLAACWAAHRAMTASDSMQVHAPTEEDEDDFLTPFSF